MDCSLNFACHRGKLEISGFCKSEINHEETLFSAIWNTTPVEIYIIMRLVFYQFKNSPSEITSLATTLTVSAFWLGTQSWLFLSFNIHKWTKNCGWTLQTEITQLMFRFTNAAWSRQVPCSMFELWRQILEWILSCHALMVG